MSDIGIVIGTYASLPYVHLQLESIKRLHPALPVLVHDDCSPQQSQLIDLCRQYGADFVTTTRHAGHPNGDAAAFAAGLRWARCKGFRLLVKISRRWIWKEPWLESLLDIEAASHCLTYSNLTTAYGIGFRTECIGLNVQAWSQPSILQRIDYLTCHPVDGYLEAHIHKIAKDIEAADASAACYHKALIRQPDALGYGVWDALGTSRTDKMASRLWHDIDQPADYAAYAQELGLSYAANDFDVSQFKTQPTKLVIHQHQSPGDIMVLTAAVRDLHLAHPGRYLTDVRTTGPEIWLNNPYITPMAESDCQRIDAQYNHIHKSNGSAYGFIHSYHFDLEQKLGISIPVTSNRCDIHLSESERQSKPVTDRPYWIIDAGHKNDFTAKHWGFDNYQSVIDRCPDIQFVQVGANHPGHTHQHLVGKNVIDFVGKTSIRELILLVHHSYGVLTPISFPLHLGYSVPPAIRYQRKARPTICLAGGREPLEWLACPNTQFLHTNGLLNCNQSGGCWKSKTVQIDADKSLCLHPVKLGSEHIPYCMSLIRPEYVAYLIQASTAELG